MKKIVVVNGSPRKKGNTMSMVKIIEDEMKAQDPSVSFEYIHLIDQNLGYCLGCNQCLLQGPDKCLKKDDGQEILKTMLSADGLIFASPGYAAMVSGLYKNFMDRFMYLDHMPEFGGVPALIVSTSGGDGVGGAPKFMANNGIVWWGCHVVDQIGIGHAFYVMNQKQRQKADKRLKKASKMLYGAIVSERKVKPSFRSYMYYIFNKSEGEISPSAQPARYAFWVEQGYFDAYYYDTTINPLYRMVGASFSGIMKLVFKLLLGKEADKKLGDWTHNRYQV